MTEGPDCEGPNTSDLESPASVESGVGKKLAGTQCARFENFLPLTTPGGAIAISIIGSLTRCTAMTRLLMVPHCVCVLRGIAKGSARLMNWYV